MSSEQQESVARARQMLQEGRVADAAELLTAVAEVDPSNADAHLYLGMAEGRLGNMPAAVDSIRHARDLRPDDTSVAYNLAVALSRSGQTDLARAELERVLQADPQNARARSALDALGVPTDQAPADPLRLELTTPWAPAAPAPSTVAQPFDFGQPGMRSPTVVQQQFVAPTTGTRLARGLGWGLLCGQIWTGWMLFWSIVWSGARLGGLGIAAMAILFTIVFAIAGALTGVIIGASGADRSKSGLIGGVVGLALWAAEMALSGSAMMIVNVLFWFFTGQAVGSAIGGRVNKPVEARPGRHIG